MKGILIKVGINVVSIVLAIVVLYFLMKVIAKAKGGCGCGCGGTCKTGTGVSGVPAKPMSDYEFSILTQ